MDFAVLRIQNDLREYHTQRTTPCENCTTRISGYIAYSASGECNQEMADESLMLDMYQQIVHYEKKQSVPLGKIQIEMLVTCHRAIG